MLESGSSCLFVVLGSSIELHLFPTLQDKERAVGPSAFTLICSENGFYDYLRDCNGEIVGLRFSPFEMETILDYATPLTYTYVDAKRSYVEIYFRGHKGTPVPGVADQAFGDDSLWRSDVGVYALQVGTTVLTQRELDSLMPLIARG